MHRGHRASKLVHFHNSRTHLRILANETGSGIATIATIQAIARATNKFEETQNK